MRLPCAFSLRRGIVRLHLIAQHAYRSWRWHTDRQPFVGALHNRAGYSNSGIHQHCLIQCLISLMRPQIMLAALLSGCSQLTCANGALLSLMNCSAAFKPARANAPRRLATVRPQVTHESAAGLQQHCTKAQQCLSTLGAGDYTRGPLLSCCCKSKSSSITSICLQPLNKLNSHIL